MTIITYQEKYKEDMLSMIMEARLAMGLSSTVRQDLYDVKGNYLDKGDGFFLAIDAQNRVLGCVGFSRIFGTDEAFLHRFYVRADRKRQGIGTQLLHAAEKCMRGQGIRLSRVHLGASAELWFESYAFYPGKGYSEYAPRYMKKEL